MRHFEEDVQLSPMEVFLLAMVDAGGLRTLSDLLLSAGLSTGGVAPALRRLQKAGFLERDEKPKERKKQYSPTLAGVSQIAEDWELALDPDLREVESVLRSAWVAWLHAPQEARSFLMKAAVRRHQLAEKQEHKALKLKPSENNLVETYKWMRALTTANRLRGEAEGLRKLADVLPAGEPVYKHERKLATPDDLLSSKHVSLGKDH
jgi:DNA-binding PadR family transcriptional regulator